MNVRFQNVKETLATKQRGMAHRIVYRLYGICIISEVKKVTQRGNALYKCKLPLGEKVEITKVDDQWIDIKARRPTEVSLAIGSSIERVRM